MLREKATVQQFVPMSSSLNAALTLYLKVWDWEAEDFLFPGTRKEQIQAHTLELAIRKYNLARGVTLYKRHLTYEIIKGMIKSRKETVTHEKSYHYCLV